MKTMKISTSFEETLQWANAYNPEEDSGYDYGIQVGFILVFVTVVGICLFLIKDKCDILDQEESDSDSEEFYDEEEDGEFYDGDEAEYSGEPTQNEMRPGSIERSIQSRPQLLKTTMANR